MSPEFSNIKMAIPLFLQNTQWVGMSFLFDFPFLLVLFLDINCSYREILILAYPMRLTPINMCCWARFHNFVTHFKAISQLLPRIWACNSIRWRSAPFKENDTFMIDNFIWKLMIWYVSFTAFISIFGFVNSEGEL